jgi:hypothetical protein
MKFEEIYVTGEYLEKNPTWHVERSPWKAKQILKMVSRSGIAPETICEVGCGAGEILAQLQKEMDPSCSFWGYEISPQAIELAKRRENEKLHFKLADFKQEDVLFDLILIVDTLEHMEDCYSFLRNIKSKSQYKIIHFGLDLTVESLMRPNALLGFRSTRGHVGHVHYFTKNMAIAMLEDMGYEVVNYFYTPRGLDFAQTLKRKLLQIPRSLFFSIRQDLAVRVLGGYGLLVLVK